MLNEKTLARYSRQIGLEEIGEHGQEAIIHASIVIIGTGALGTANAERLVRAGVGHVRLVDKDKVELSNLPRQSLFIEEDAVKARPKAKAAYEKLKAINSDTYLEASMERASADNIERLIQSADCIIDATDNFQTRYLINDAAIKHNIPWIYGGVSNTGGTAFTILPHETACFRCLFPEKKTPEEGFPASNAPSVLGTIVQLIAALQSTECLKILINRRDLVLKRLTTVDIWSGRFDSLDIRNSRVLNCTCCGLGKYDYLEDTV